MKIRTTNLLSALFSSLGLTTTLQDADAVLSIILTALGLAVLLTNIILRVADKISKAKEDGKITKDELVDIAKDVKDGYEEAKDFIDKSKRGE